MVANNVRCHSGEIVGESLSNLSLIFNNAILMFIFEEYWISIFCFVVQERSKCIENFMWFGLQFFRLLVPVCSKSFPSFTSGNISILLFKFKFFQCAVFCKLNGIFPLVSNSRFPFFRHETYISFTNPFLSHGSMFICNTIKKISPIAISII